MTDTTEATQALAAARSHLASAREAHAAGQQAAAAVSVHTSVFAAVKAVLHALGEPAEDEERLNDLLDWLPPAHQATFLDELRTLDAYYVPSGDPADLPVSALKDTPLDDALRWAGETLDTAATIVADLA